MATGGSCLGVCYSENQLFYSVNSPGQGGQLSHIGCIDFNFEIEQTIIKTESAGFPALKKSLENLQQAFNCSFAKILTPSNEECWAIVPKAVYEDASEREAHIQLLMKGSDRSEIQAIWYPVSKNDRRLLLLRDNKSMKGFNSLLRSFSQTEHIADFELGVDWQLHTKNNGAFLMVHCRRNYLSVSSFVLGKLRGCTYIEYDHITDLPYLWSLYAENLSWLTGLHDYTYLFGPLCSHVEEILNPFWSDYGEISSLSTLEKMGVTAPEKTYGFALESAFPAIIMSLNTDIETPMMHENYNR
ncbi:MAG: hypothetical protein JJU13_14435 [Balneolaceae bacterium]|nr:hypothetical protein [Balneolaceae bacterium]